MEKISKIIELRNMNCHNQFDIINIKNNVFGCFQYYGDQTSNPHCICKIKQNILNPNFNFHFFTQVPDIFLPSSFQNRKLNNISNSYHSNGNSQPQLQQLPQQLHNGSFASTFIPPFSWIHKNHSLPNNVAHNNILFDGFTRKSTQSLQGDPENR